jgi:hypothetical protein
MVLGASGWLLGADNVCETGDDDLRLPDAEPTRIDREPSVKRR